MPFMSSNCKQAKEVVNEKKKKKKRKLSRLLRREHLLFHDLHSWSLVSGSHPVLATLEKSSRGTCSQGWPDWIGHSLPRWRFHRGVKRPALEDFEKPLASLGHLVLNARGHAGAGEGRMRMSLGAGLTQALVIQVVVCSLPPGIFRGALGCADVITDL